MSEHEAKSENRVEDLDVPETESDEVKGGLLLPAVQAVREAARRSPAASKHGGEIEIESWSLG